MISARRQFLDAFLGALGASEIVECLERATEISGTLRFAEDSEAIDLTGDEDELQAFVWRVAETDVPSLLTYRIADVMHRYHLLSIDKLRVSRETLLSILRTDFDEPVAQADFDVALAALFDIEVPMLENGVETGDAFFIHE
jgi:hypothetical protein